MKNITRPLLISAIGLLYSAMVAGCGGGGSSALPGSITTASDNSLSVSTNKITTAGGTSNAKSSTADPHQSADFGTWFIMPTTLTSAEQFTWITPMPHSGELAAAKQYALAPSRVSVPFNAFITKSTDDAICAVSYSEAVANGWLLFTAPISGTNLYAIDPAAPGYAEAWAAKAIAAAATFNSDSVTADSVDAKLSWHTSMPSKYDTDAKWQAAMGQFLQTVSTKLHAAGLKFYMNLSLGRGVSRQAAPWKTWVSYTDGALNEFFAFDTDNGNPTPYASSSIMDMQINDVQTSANRVFMISHVVPSDPAFAQKIKYSLAAYLICRRDGDVFILHNGTSAMTSTWWDSTTFPGAKQLGHYLAPPTKIAGVWVRQYANGVVLLNDTDSAISIPASMQSKTGNQTSVAARTGVIVKQR